MKSQEPVQILVFKDNFAARSFQVPQGWFSKLGFLLGIGAFLWIVTASSSVYFFWKARKLSPTHVQELEYENHDLKARLSQNSGGALSPNSVPAPVAPVTQSPQLAPSTTRPAEALPAATVPLAQASSSVSVDHGKSIELGSAPFLKWTETLPDPNKLPFRLAPLQVGWKGKFLQIRSSLQYISEDGGHQQGRILLIAWGPGILATHPNTGVIDLDSSVSVLNGEHGEYFSVSRLRPISVDLGPFENKSAISSVVALILTQEGHPIRIERFTVNSNLAPPKAIPNASDAIQESPIPGPIKSSHAGASEE